MWSTHSDLAFALSFHYMIFVSRGGPASYSYDGCGSDTAYYFTEGNVARAQTCAMSPCPPCRGSGNGSASLVEFPHDVRDGREDVWHATCHEFVVPFPSVFHTGQIEVTRRSVKSTPTAHTFFSCTVVVQSSCH